jgi:hypothetical protein
VRPKLRPSANAAVRPCLGIAFAVGSNNLDTIFEKPSSGTADEGKLYKKIGPTQLSERLVERWAFLAVLHRQYNENRVDIWVLPMQGREGASREPVLLLGTEFNEFLGSLRWISYTSDESGRDEVYVRPFLTSGPLGVPAVAQGKWQISKDGGVFSNGGQMGRRLSSKILRALTGPWSWPWT